jgi:hypothetical protein
MSVLDVNYSFKILSADVEQSTVLIEYNPADDDVMPITLNCNIILADPASFPGEGYDNPEDIPFAEHLKVTATMQAPLSTWRSQKWAVLNGTALTNQIASNTYISIT